MTANELRKQFNDTYGLREWPKTFKVTPETYAHVCNDIFQIKNKHNHSNLNIIEIAVGSHGGIMFKNVELTF